MASHLTTTEEFENQSDDSESSGNSLFKTQCAPPTPKRGRKPHLRRSVQSDSAQARDSSSDSSWEPRPLTLKAAFEKFKVKKRKRKKYKPTGRPRGRPKGSKNTKSSQIDKKQFKEREPGFPFLETKRNPLPWKTVLTFEQAVARGFFKYVEKLKYEYHLKESLKKMNAGEDLEKEDLDSRRYKYLDDDGSISPIEEPLDEDEDPTREHSDDDCDIKLVEDNCFIISCDFPKKRKANLNEDNTEDATLFRKRTLRSKIMGEKDRMT